MRHAIKRLPDGDGGSVVRVVPAVLGRHSSENPRIVQRVATNAVLAVAAALSLSYLATLLLSPVAP